MYDGGKILVIEMMKDIMYIRALLPKSLGMKIIL